MFDAKVREQVDHRDADYLAGTGFTQSLSENGQGHLFAVATNAYPRDETVRIVRMDDHRELQAVIRFGSQLDVMGNVAKPPEPMGLGFGADE